MVSSAFGMAFGVGSDICIGMHYMGQWVGWVSSAGSGISCSFI
jgi:hypothetical protein